jgi:disulfide bond formation protein DsbB
MTRKIPFYPFCFWPIYWIFLGGIGFAIIGVWVMDFGFHVKPCPLCLWQRIPYYAGAVILIPYGLLTIFSSKIRHSLSLRCFLFILLMILFFSGFIVASYHAGIEWHFWEQSHICAENITFLDFDQFQKDLPYASVARCDEAPFRIFGLSPAGWNVILSSGFFALSFLSAWRCRS